MDGLSVLDVLGKEWMDLAVLRFLDVIAPIRGCELSGGGIYEANEHGVKIHLAKPDGNRRVSEIRLFSMHADRGGQYTGRLPYDLSFEDTRLDVTRKLGDPDASTSPYAYPAPMTMLVMQGTVDVDPESSSEAWDDYESTRLPSE